MDENSWGSTSSPSLSAVSVLDFGHSNKCVVVSHCRYNLHFSNDIRAGASFHVLFAICISSLVKCLFSSHFFNGIFVSLWFIFKGSLHILDNGPLSNIFSLSLVYLFFLLIMYFSEQKIFISMKFSLSTLSFMHHAFDVYSKESLPNLNSSRFFSYIILLVFYSFAFTFRSMAHFELISVKSVKSVL
jgi:hypothetical protein